MALPKVMIGSLEKVGGSVAAGPLNTALPTDAKSELDPAFKTRGLIGVEGFTWSPEREDTEIEVEGGLVARTLTTKYKERISLTFMEAANAEVLKAVFGEKNVEAKDKKVSIKHNALDPAELAWVISLKDGDGRRRLVIPRGQLKLSGEIAFVHNDAIKYPVEITALADDNGNYTYEYIEDTATGPAA
ncbi:hypothetical protein [Trueperella sp. LYQ143]|uniref:phage tail tube protein n=1 Tax=unclassified Trueperella TaxID=2630174 RepID=UPI0039834B2F